MTWREVYTSTADAVSTHEAIADAARRSEAMVRAQREYARIAECYTPGVGVVVPETVQEWAHVVA